jgi:two-component system nitrogen regulation response regulator GlnG
MSFETNRARLKYLPGATANRAEGAATRDGTTGALLDHRTFSLETHSAPALRIVQAAEDRPDRGKAARLLVIVDPAASPENPSDCFRGSRHRVRIVGTGNEGLERVRTDSPDVVILDVGAHLRSGLEVFQQIRRIDATVPVVFVTSTNESDLTIEAMRQGAYDCLLKPLDLSALWTVVGEALDVARHISGRLAAEDEARGAVDTVGSIVGCCRSMREVFKSIGRIADQNVPVLITGETGTGKELVARAIQQHGQRASAPFLALNCAAIPEQLLESELFGHEKGAFTGADRRRIGKFEQCHGGTLFLDEIGDMPVSLQAKILRLMQEQAFDRLGGNETIRTDVRLIAATHRDLRAWSEDGKFRPDLYYRLGVFTIHLPPLRERGEDLPLLVRHFVRLFSPALNRDVREVAPETLERLRAYDWPGNVRELQSVLKQALLRASGTVLVPAFLPQLPGGSRSHGVSGLPTEEAWDMGSLIRQRLEKDCRDLYSEVHRELDRVLLPRVLEHAEGSQHQAARLLGIARQTLRLKMRDFGHA